MKQIVLITILLLQSLNVTAQKQAAFQESIPVYFEEIKEATKKHKNLWGRILYGPMLLVDRKSRKVYANEPDSTGILKYNGSIYTGILPNDVNIANKSVDWSDKKWAMIMLPLSQNKQNRINLMAHELFHRAQPSLNFEMFNPKNNHLDKKDGRIYLRLELEALKKAIQSPSKKEIKKHTTNALVFRKYRHSLYPGSDSTENLLELNEGITEYTGAIISGRNHKQMTKYFIKGINHFYKNPTFVRSFAYYNTPIYGYLLYKTNKNWHKEISVETSLTNYFAKAFDVKIPIDLTERISDILRYYNGDIIIQEETEREKKTKKLIAGYKNKFVEQPHFEIDFEQMNMSFDPNNVMPLEDKGTVYPNIRVTDLWGILEVENGALISPNWDKISISNPDKIRGSHITGDGWVLDLNNGYAIEKERNGGNYKLKKKEQ